MSLPRGNSMSTLRKLCVRAPRMRMGDKDMVCDVQRLAIRDTKRETRKTAMRLRETRFCLQSRRPRRDKVFYRLLYKSPVFPDAFAASASYNAATSGSPDLSEADSL